MSAVQQAVGFLEVGQSCLKRRSLRSGSNTGLPRASWQLNRLRPGSQHTANFVLGCLEKTTMPFRGVLWSSWSSCHFSSFHISSVLCHRREMLHNCGEHPDDLARSYLLPTTTYVPRHRKKNTALLFSLPQILS